MFVMEEETICECKLKRGNSVRGTIDEGLIKHTETLDPVLSKWDLTWIEWIVTFSGRVPSEYCTPGLNRTLEVTTLWFSPKNIRNISKKTFIGSFERGELRRILSRSANGNLVAMLSSPKPKRTQIRLWSKCLWLWKDQFQDPKRRKSRKWKGSSPQIFTKQLQSEINPRSNLLRTSLKLIYKTKAALLASQMLYLEILGSLLSTKLRTSIVMQEWAHNTMTNQPPIIWATRV